MYALSHGSCAPPCPWEGVLADLAPRLFASFTRADHRAKGVQYLRGLLTAPGRKSIANIARSLGDPASAQRLHHFIHDAPWDWWPVRAALARCLSDIAAPRAWVVLPLLIPRRGRHAAGVHRRFLPASGQLVNGQQAHGLWYAAGALNAPVDWHLQVPAEGRLPPGPRGTPASPDASGPVATFEAPRGFSAVPVLWDIRAHEAAGLRRALEGPQRPVMVSLSGECALRLVAPSGRSVPDAAVPVAEILAAPQAARLTTAPVAPGVRALTVRALLPRPPGEAAGPEIALYAQWRPGTYEPGEYWATTLSRTPVSELYQLTRLAAQVARDSTRTGAGTGLRDFKGRSFDGWHRHMTMASAAYAAVKLGGMSGRIPQ
ncbi:transposase [Streptomyces albofaciens JCM 4342]|uniref:IS701 family transposase n=1 Tax=Streptomyces albofaciens TaxID=66866 RepID=UPI00123C6418|nr:transposase [Streptomyces albofaciens]KAA6212726.1 transposase [Streptomyces albofaciens JCM 4342]